LAGQCHNSHHGGNHQRSGDEQHETSALTAVPSRRGMLPNRFLTVAHRCFSYREHTHRRGPPTRYPFPPAWLPFSFYYTISIIR
jgi:hypothetical protein